MTSILGFSCGVFLLVVGGLFLTFMRRKGMGGTDNTDPGNFEDMMSLLTKISRRRQQVLFLRSFFRKELPDWEIAVNFLDKNTHPNLDAEGFSLVIYNAQHSPAGTCFFPEEELGRISIETLGHQVVTQCKLSTCISVSPQRERGH